jgi:hypothetical protein
LMVGLYFPLNLTRRHTSIDPFPQIEHFFVIPRRKLNIFSCYYILTFGYFCNHCYLYNQGF